MWSHRISRVGRDPKGSSQLENLWKYFFIKTSSRVTLSLLFYNQCIVFNARHALLDFPKIHGLSLGYDVNPSILERQGMENQAANRVNLCLYLGALDLSHILDFQQFVRVGYRSCVLLQVSLETGLFSHPISKCL